jgi:XTP/dITP diphosphohydrolase
MRKPALPPLLLATSNLHKIAEIKSILQGEGKLLTLKDFPALPAVEESGPSFRSNALIKARFYAKAAGILTLADDSGLSIEYLKGAPGIHSARFGGETTPYAEKNQIILKLMNGVPWEKRKAKFYCVAALVTPEGRTWVRQGSLSGYIAYEAKGKYGFGYDPIFYLPKFKKNLAELPPEIKNTISHRYKAFQKIAEILNNLR